MKQNLTRKGGVALLSLAMMLSADMAKAAVIEHGADRYIINVQEMNLNGEETVLDILMMLPDVMTIDGRTVIGNEVDNATQKKLFGQYAVRVDNMNIQVNPEAFVKNTKAKEIKCIKVCTNPGIQKGCGTLKQVIDIYYRSKDNGNEGRVAVEGDTYGKAGVFATNWTTTDKSDLHLYAIGDLENRKFVDEGVKMHGFNENVRAHYNWNITDKDNMIITGAQTYNRERAIGNPAAYSRTFNFDACYTRDLGNGAYAMFEGGVDYNHSNEPGVRVMGTNPYGVIEFGAPFISNNLYLNGGVESGYSGETEEQFGQSVTSRSRYEDIYAQLDWNCGWFHFSVGDRVRFSTNYFSNEYKNNIFNHTATSNHFTASTWFNLSDNNTLQATFARRFDGPDMQPVLFLMNGETWNGYVKDVFESPIYTTELRYTFQKEDFTLAGIVKNLHKNFATGDMDHDNILQVGATAFMHKGVLRLTAGISYNWQKSTFVGDDVKYNNFVHLKLAPQVSLSNGWRFTSTMLYNSRKAYDSEYYTPANFYADVAASKEINKNWLVEAKYHDIAGQHTGNRAVTVGFTYYWGK